MRTDYTGVGALVLLLSIVRLHMKRVELLANADIVARRIRALVLLEHVNQVVGCILPIKRVSESIPPRWGPSSVVSAAGSSFRPQ